MAYQKQIFVQIIAYLTNINLLYLPMTLIHTMPSIWTLLDRL